MSESAIESGPSLEQILWRAMDRWEERPALLDAEEFAARIAGIFEGEIPAEAWVERFFEGADKMHRPPADMAEAIVRATKERMHVYEFDLRRLEYVIVEDEKQVVVVSEFGQFALQNDDRVSRAIDSAVLPARPAATEGRRSGQPKAYLLRKSGEVVAVDVKKVAGTLQQLIVKQVSMPAVDAPSKRLAPFSPTKRKLSETREERALRQDPRARQAVPLPPKLLKSLEGKAARTPPPAAAKTALFVLMPDGQLARAEIGSATRWRQMVGLAARSSSSAPVPVSAGQRVTIQAGNVVAIINKTGSVTLPGSTGQRALARGEAIAAVRSDSAPVRVLRNDELDQALAAGAQVVPGLAHGNRYWIQPEKAYKPDAPEKPAVVGQPLRLGELTGDPWADWALTGGGEMSPAAMTALRGRTRAALRSALDGSTDGASIPPELVDRMRGVQGGQLDLAGAPVVGFRSPDGSVIVSRPLGPIRLAALDRPEAALRPIDMPLPGPGGTVEIAPLSGAVPATALATLQLALERTASAGGYRLPIGKLESALDALDAGAAMNLDIDDPRRTTVRLAGPAYLGGATGQTAQLVLSMPFPNQGEIHVGDDLAQALQSYLSAPVMPASYAPGVVVGGGALAGAAGGGMLLRLRGGESLSPDGLPLDWSGLNSQAAMRARDAVVTLDLPDVQPLVASGSRSVSGLPFLLQRALEAGADWVPGPGAPVPTSIRELALSGPYDQFAPSESIVVQGRAPNPGEEEIVIPMPLWAQMGGGRVSETDQIMASPLAQAGYQPPLGVYRLLIPPGGAVDMTGGAPSGTPGIVDLDGPMALELTAKAGRRVTATSLGGRQVIGRVAIDDGQTVVTQSGRISIVPDAQPTSADATAAASDASATPDSSASSNTVLSQGGDAPDSTPTVVSGSQPQVPDASPAPATYVDGTYTAPPSSGANAAPMTGALSSAMSMSNDVDARTSPPGRPSNIGQSDGSSSSSDGSSSATDSSDFSSDAQAAGQSDASSSPGYSGGADGSDQTLVVASSSAAQGAAAGAQVGASSVSDASSASSDAASATTSATTQVSQSGTPSTATPSFITGLQPGLWSGHDRRTTPNYQTWSYGTDRDDTSQTAGGVVLGSLARPVYPSLPTALRFRYVGAPLWWTNSTAEAGGAAPGEGAEQEGTPATRAMRAGLRAATSAASIWRSILIASPQWGGGPVDDVTGGMDTAQDANAAEMSSLSRSFDALAAGTLVSGAAAGAAGGAGYIAMSSSGSAGAVSPGAASLARADSVEMSIVAAIPPKPPPLESMGSSGFAAAHARGKSAGAAAAKNEHKESADTPSHSKIEGSVDAIAQRIYHRIRRRIQSDRERFGG